MAKRVNALGNALTYLRRGPRLNEGWSEESPRGRQWERLYRDRWQHDKVVRSTHGVNCTGSCSWKIHVKDGIITWETQQTDYPSLGPDSPEYEPRGCPRGASFSWYEYSPLRIRYPYVRGSLITAWREAMGEAKDPVAAWRLLTSSEERRATYRSQRGKGGFVRASWEEISELIAAATVDTVRHYGPDRVVGFTPIPAMSMVSYAAGTRFLSLIGGTILSFYDWYADLPIASPQIWGEQTDVPESADWFNAEYMIVWGTNLPMTRTPDAHFMVEARYKGTRVAAVSPDYAEYVKFSDLWLPAKAGTDAALAMAMMHVILKECYVDRQVPYFQDYARRFTDLPFLVRLVERDGRHYADRFLRASDLGATGDADAWKTIVWDEAAAAPACPNGSLGYRWDGSGRWNLRLEKDGGAPVSPALTFLGSEDRSVALDFPYFGSGKGETLSRHVPVREIEGSAGRELVTTVFDLLLASVGVGRGLPGDYPQGYDDPGPYTPAWQEAITGVERSLAIQVAREFAEAAEKTRGRAMIAMGAGINHWYHSDVIYRAIVGLVLLTGCEGVNGGGWAHYVGQEKVRPLEGWSTVAFAGDWVPAARQQNGTSFFYFATDQFRYEDLDTGELTWPGGGKFATMHPADVNALAARLGWLPSYPQFRENSLETARKARAESEDDAEAVLSVARRLKEGDLAFSVDAPDLEENFPRVFFLWRANLLTSSGKGHEYFLRHLLGADGHILAGEDGMRRPETVACEGEAPRGKLDLLVDIDFRMTGSGLYADIVLPAATWYEKHDISSTDMHPFVHPFNPAISPPWETRSDWDTFRTIARRFSELAKDHLPAQEDLLMAPLLHDTPQETAQPLGEVRDWRKGEAEAVPGQTMPRLLFVQRDYPHVYEQMTTLGPRAERQIVQKGITIPTAEAFEALQRELGTSRREGPGKGRPRLETAEQVANAVLRLSGATNGHQAVAAWKALEPSTGLRLADVARGREDDVYTVKDLTAQPRLAIATPVWSGLETHGRRYAPFTANVELEIPWRTLTGRQHFYVDHQVMLDFGEGLPVYRPPLSVHPFPAGKGVPAEGKQLTLRYLTPHGKWGIHSTYTDTLTMLTLFRGGPTIWLSPKDAAALDVKDNDWLEALNRNGAVAARAVVSHRIPEGVAIMYHAQDRTIAVPAAKATGDRGGAHNSLTRVLPKPTHMIGGYAQLSYGFNYYGPTGHQRDEMTVVRRLGEVDWLAD